MGYPKVILCNSVPSWYKAVYGNMLLIHKRLVDKCGPKDLLCKMYDETIYTFNKSTETRVVSGSHQGTKETRCYIYINIPYDNKNIHIYGTHLDVASEETRLQQIKFIMEKIRTQHQSVNDISFIMGDFNSMDREQYKTHNYAYSKEILDNEFLLESGKVVKYLKENNYYDVCGNDPLEMTTWNNTRVDFIFCNRQLKNYVVEKYFTKASDHIPVVITLKSAATEKCT